jgi:hypothetical protein
MLNACVKAVQTVSVVCVNILLLTRSLLLPSFVSGKEPGLYSWFSVFIRAVYSTFFGCLYLLFRVNTHFPQGLLK